MSSKPKSNLSNHIEFPDHDEKLKSEHLSDVASIQVDEERRHREKKLVRKLDLTLLPMVWVLYMFNYLDRNNIAQARLNTFEKDLNLSGNQFNVAVSILNVGYMLMQLPSNMILTRVRPSLYMPFWVCVWSIISAATGGVNNYSHLVVVRFFLGIAEAPFFPGAFHLLSCWYTRKELGLRTAVLYSGLVLATAFSGLIAAGIFSGLEGARGLPGWRWLFIVTGAASFLVGAFAVFVLPDFPESKTGSGKWLFTDEERQLAIERIKLDRVSDQESDRSVWHGLKLAVKDYRTWVFVLMLCSNHTAYGFNNFFPSIVRGFHLGSNAVTLVLTAPPYLVGAIISFLWAYSSDRHSERGFHIAIPMCVAIVGFIISVATLNVPARYVASFLYISGCFSANAMVYSWAASTLNATPEKRAAATAIVNLLSQLGNIWSPFFFTPGSEPRYTTAMIILIAFSALSVVTCMFMKWSLKRENSKLKMEYQGTEAALVLYTL